MAAGTGTRSDDDPDGDADLRGVTAFQTLARQSVVIRALRGAARQPAAPLAVGARRRAPGPSSLRSWRITVPCLKCEFNEIPRFRPVRVLLSVGRFRAGLPGGLGADADARLRTEHAQRRSGTFRLSRRNGPRSAHLRTDCRPLAAPLAGIRIRGVGDCHRRSGDVRLHPCADGRVFRAVYGD